MHYTVTIYYLTLPPSLSRVGHATAKEAKQNKKEDRRAVLAPEKQDDRRAVLVPEQREGSRAVLAPEHQEDSRAVLAPEQQSGLSTRTTGRQ